MVTIAKNHRYSLAGYEPHPSPFVFHMTRIFLCFAFRTSPCSLHFFYHGGSFLHPLLLPPITWVEFWFLHNHHVTHQDVLTGYSRYKKYLENKTSNYLDTTEILPFMRSLSKEIDLYLPKFLTSLPSCPYGVRPPPPFLMILLGSPEY